jgi:hypothetical protein
MKKASIVFLISAFALVLIPASGLCWHFDYEIYSQPGGILHSDPIYDGVLTSGGDGTLRIELNDTAPEPWPVDPGARFDSLWAWYFAPNYDGTPDAAKWVGQIPGRFYLTATNAPFGYNGTCEGSINAKITVRDFNEDGILSAAEKNRQHLFDGRLSKLCTDPSTGEMECKWGWGAVASNYFSFEETPVDTLYNGSDLTLMSGCSSAVEPATWGSIKSLYR